MKAALSDCGVLSTAVTAAAQQPTFSSRSTPSASTCCHGPRRGRARASARGFRGQGRGCPAGRRSRPSRAATAERDSRPRRQQTVSAVSVSNTCRARVDTLLERLAKDDRAALLTFSHAVRLRQELTGDILRLREALAGVIPSGQTSLVDGTSAAMALAGSDVGRSLLIMFSDGVDTASFLSPEVVLHSARRSDVVVYGVAMRTASAPRF